MGLEADGGLLELVTVVGPEEPSDLVPAGTNTMYRQLPHLTNPEFAVVENC
jgi:hypothetical protein